MRSARRGCALAAAVLLIWAPLRAAVAAPGGGCPPGVGIGLLDRPPSASEDPRARSYIVDRVRPGTRFSRRLKVCNGSSGPARISVYPDAASIQHGMFSLGDGASRNELTGWLSVSPASLTLAAGTSGVATVTVDVPPDATAGERYAAVVAQGPPTAGAGGLTVTSRVGLRVYLDVGAGGIAPNSFRIENFQAVRRSDGSAAVLATVRNTGPRALELAGSLQLNDGPGGLSAGPYPASLGTTLRPGEAEPVTVPVPAAVRGGPWHGVLSLHSGRLSRTAEGSLTFPDGPGTAAPPTPAREVPLLRDRSVLVPVAAGLSGLLALLVLLAALLNRRRGRRPAALS